MDDSKRNGGRNWFWLGLLGGLLGALYVAMRRSTAQLTSGVSSSDVAGRVAGWTADLTPDETGWLGNEESETPAQPANLVAKPAPDPTTAPAKKKTSTGTAKPASAARKAASGSGTTPAQRRNPQSGGWTPASAGDCPADHPIKGNAGSGIYFLPGQPNYAQTRAEICFAHEGDAIAAGYRARKR